MGQTSYHILEGGGIGLNSLAFGQGGMDLSLWAVSIPQTPSKHILGQDILFVAAP